MATRAPTAACRCSISCEHHGAGALAAGPASARARGRDARAARRTGCARRRGRAAPEALRGTRALRAGRMSWVTDLARPDILALQSLRARRAGSPGWCACMPTSCRGARRSMRSAAGLNRYPEPQPRALAAAPRSALRRRRRVDAAAWPRQRRGHRPAGRAPSAAPAGTPC